MSSEGLSVLRTRRNVATRSARPFEGEIFAGERNEHGVGRDEGVQCEQAERRRSVDEDDIEGVANPGEHGLQTALSIGEGYELDLGARQLPVRWHQRQVLHLGLEDRQFTGFVRGERVVNRRARLSLESKPAGEVALGVHVDDENALLGHGERRGEIDRRGGFANPALLVCDGDYPRRHLCCMTYLCCLFGLLATSDDTGRR